MEFLTYGVFAFGIMIFVCALAVLFSLNRQKSEQKEFLDYFAEKEQAIPEMPTAEPIKDETIKDSDEKVIDITKEPSFTEEAKIEPEVIEEESANEEPIFSEEVAKFEILPKKRIVRRRTKKKKTVKRRKSVGRPKKAGNRPKKEDINLFEEEEDYIEEDE